jgi:hypothetical protein
MTSLIKAITSLHTISLVLQLIHQTLCDTSDNVCLDLHNYNYSIQLTLVISNSMGPWKTFESTVVRLMRSYEDTGSVVCLTTKGRQLNIRLSARAVRNRLKSAGLKSKAVIKRTIWSDRHQRLRLPWCLARRFVLISGPCG